MHRQDRAGRPAAAGWAGNRSAVSVLEQPGVGEVGLTSVLPCPQRRSRPALLAWVTAKTHRGESPPSPRGTYSISLILLLQEKVDVEGGSLMMKYLI